MGESPGLEARNCMLSSRVRVCLGYGEQDHAEG